MSLTPCQGDYISGFFSAAVQVVCCIGSTMCIVLLAYQFTLRFLQIHGGASGMSLIPSQGDYVSGSFLVEVWVIFYIDSVLCTCQFTLGFFQVDGGASGLFLTPPSMCLYQQIISCCVGCSAPLGGACLVVSVLSSLYLMTLDQTLN